MIFWGSKGGKERGGVVVECFNAQGKAYPQGRRLSADTEWMRE